MDIRRDLESVSVYLERLSLLGDVFAENNNINWSNLKNKEDFNKVYSLDVNAKIKFERIYQTGRDLAVYMSHKLKAFNYPDEYPNLKSYVESFEKGWLTEIVQLERKLPCQVDSLKVEFPV